MADSPERQRSFFISAGETTEGPFDLAALRARAASGLVDSRYQVWDEAAGNWAPYSFLEEFLRQSTEGPARVKPVRAPKAVLAAPPAPSTAAGGSTAGRPFSFGANASRATLMEGETLGGPVPRVVSQRLGGTFYEPEPEEPPPAPAKKEEKPEPRAEPPPPPRRRNYSPMSAGASAARPFEPLSRTSEDYETATPIEIEGEDPGAAEEPPVEPQRATWWIAAGCVSLCLLALAVLWAAGLVNFGFRVREENQRLTTELKALQERLAAKERGFKTIMRDKEDYLARFLAAQMAVRNIRISVFASTKRELQSGDRLAVDQRLFELDQLNKLVPENEAEKKMRHELTDAFFSSLHPAAKPPTDTSPPPPPGNADPPR